MTLTTYTLLYHVFLPPFLHDGSGLRTRQKLCGNRIKWRLCKVGAGMDRWKESDVQNNVPFVLKIIRNCILKNERFYY